MADNARKVSACPSVNSVAATDSLVGYAAANGVPNTVLVPLSVVLGNTAATHRIKNGFSLVVTTPYTPANSTANSTVEKGTVMWDTSYMYIATANGHIKRATLSDF